MPNTTPTVTTLPDWVLTEEVEVTLVHHDPDAVRDIFLVTCVPVRRGANNAITLTFEEGRVLINGTYVDLGEDLMAVCSLVDEAGRWAAPDAMMPLSVTYRSNPSQTLGPYTTDFD